MINCHSLLPARAPLNSVVRPMIASNPQDSVVRRAYLVRPRLELAERLAAIGLSDDYDLLGQPTVVMTKPVPFEEALEGNRSRVLTLCKESFLRDLLEFPPLSEPTSRSALLGDGLALAESFDLWWNAEEVETIEIETAW